jgi:RHS repeat-associated protein
VNGRASRNITNCFMSDDYTYPGATSLLDDGLGSTTVTFNGTGVQAAQLYGPFGQLRWSGGTMPTSYGFTGHRADAATGLDYYNARYYDPAASRFTSADTVLPGNGMDPAGLDRYAYVENNPETHQDQDGHCWPFCTMVIGAIVGAAVSAATSVVTQVASGHKVDWHEVAKQAAVGAVAGAISGLAGPEAGPLARAAIDGLANAGGQMLSNALDGKPLTDGVLEAGLQGAAMSVGMGALMKVGGRLIKGAGNLIHSAGEDAEGDVGVAAEGGCSFSADTKVATPSGEQAIGTLKVGDQVLAYNPQTGKASTQTVQHVFINHDNDLIDVKLQTDDSSAKSGNVKPEPASQVKPQEETLHTTYTHPFLTLELGWVQAGQLKAGMHVIRADGTTGVVESVVVVPGAGTMYNLEVSNLHTYEVGAERWVVHNKCTNADRAKLRRNLGTPSGDQAHHIIPCECRNHLLVTASGLDINTARNGISLAEDSYQLAF